jgi:hypothetical protein
MRVMFSREFEGGSALNNGVRSPSRWRPHVDGPRAIQSNLSPHFGGQVVMYRSFITYWLKGASKEPKYGAGDGFGAPGVLCHDRIAPWKPCSFVNGLFDG